MRITKKTQSRIERTGFVQSGDKSTLFLDENNNQKLDSNEKFIASFDPKLKDYAPVSRQKLQKLIAESGENSIKSLKLQVMSKNELGGRVFFYSATQGKYTSYEPVFGPLKRYQETTTEDSLVELSSDGVILAQRVKEDTGLTLAFG